MQFFLFSDETRQLYYLTKQSRGNNLTLFFVLQSLKVNFSNILDLLYVKF